MSFALRLSGIAAVIGLSACSNFAIENTSVAALADMATAPDVTEALAQAALADADFARIIGNGEACSGALTTCIPGTAFGKIPSTGMATFTGPGTVSVFDQSAAVGDQDLGGRVVQMLGTASVTYDFASDEFSGRIEDMFATNADNSETDVVGGIIRISDGGQADPTDVPTLLEATATGRIDAFGVLYDITVPLEGLLRGTSPNADVPVKALSLEGDNGSVAGQSDLNVSIQTAGDQDSEASGAFING